MASRTFTGIAADRDEELTTRERAMAHQLENRKVDTDQMGEFYKHMFRMTALLTLLMIVLIWCYFFAPKDRCASRPTAPACRSPRPPPRAVACASQVTASRSTASSTVRTSIARAC